MKKFLTILLCFCSFALCADIWNNVVTAPQSSFNPHSDIQQQPISDIPSSSRADYKGNIRTGKIVSVFDIDSGENLDYNTQIIGKIDIKPLEDGIQFKTNLSVDQYQLLVKDYLNSIYSNRFNSRAWALRYFVRTLAEMAYSHDGYVSTRNFDTVLEGFKNYQTIDKYISKLDVSTDIKYSLAKLFAAGCVYTRFVGGRITQRAITAINKIPKDVILYRAQIPEDEVIQENPTSDTNTTTDTASTNSQSLEKDQLGNFVGYKQGENLYYICMSYYSNFKDLSRERQLKLINQIYEYNPTLMKAPPLKRKAFAFYYLWNYFFPQKNPDLLKYCLRPQVSWVLLPKTVY